MLSINNFVFRIYENVNIVDDDFEKDRSVELLKCFLKDVIKECFFFLLFIFYCLDIDLIV